MNDLERAKKEYPEGQDCSFCGHANDFADDCGWFFIHPDAQRGTYDSEGFYVSNNGEGGYACRACYFGEPGKKHVAFFGLGER